MTNDERPSLNSFDRVAHVYDETRGMPAEASAAIAGGLARLLRGVAEAPRAFEVGIGTGRIAVPLAQAGVRVAGIDISANMLGLLREKGAGIDVMLAEAAQPPLRERSFDGAIFVHILHLVPDAEATVRATLPLVRAGGLLVRGQEDHHRTPRADADAIIREAAREVTGIELSGWDRHERSRATFERVTTEAGGTIENVQLARWRSAQRPRQFLERLERQDYSASWRIPAEALPAIIALAAPRIAALYGGLDGEISYERTFAATVARLPR